MLAVLFLFLAGQPSHRCLGGGGGSSDGVHGGERGGYAGLDLCNIATVLRMSQPVHRVLPLEHQFPPRLSCVTPSYPEERPPGCQEERSS